MVSEASPDREEIEGGEWDEEPASIEVWRWGRAVRVAIRSEKSMGKAIELTRQEARDLISDIERALLSTVRKVRDEPRAD